ncbi:MAG TPA: divalent-cation tolerance protein CutA [Gemmatimonadota bacterium]|nr:divalent-cation tolerance protein CutA [Gemmatimonadota bacterium]
MTGLRDGADVVVVLVTCPDEETAGSIARTLVEERLAACVSVTAHMRSVYRWRGSVEEAREHLLVVKARADRLDDLAVRIVELHPYEVPEVLALPVERGLAPYLDWIRAEGG